LMILVPRLGVEPVSSGPEHTPKGSGEKGKDK
jgi:hypothetical protein